MKNEQPSKSMAETPPVVQAPVAAPQADTAPPPVQTPAPVQNIAPVAPPETPPAPQPVSPLQNIVPQPITPAVAAQLTVDMDSLTAEVDKAYGRT